jgi:hypothetical protein
MAYRAFVAVLGAALLVSHDSLRKIAVIDVPGPKGQRFDYPMIDAEDHYLCPAISAQASYMWLICAQTIW